MTSQVLEAKDRIIPALDVPTIDEALRLVEMLQPYVGGFKVGLELITSTFAALASRKTSHHDRHELVDKLNVLFSKLEGRFFYDGKWDDIPNTIKGAAEGVAPISPKWVNLHVSAGPAAIKAAVDAKGSSRVLGVTVLTSISDEYDDKGIIWSERIFGKLAAEKVPEFAQMLVDGGADGIVCSPLELPILQRMGFLDKLESMIPGIRFGEPGSEDDQRRTSTPGGAVAAGAKWIVMGRDIIRADDPVAAAMRAAAEIEQALKAA